MTEMNAPSQRHSWLLPLAGAQMLFVAFGALVLMPLLTGLDPNVALFTAGAGTLLFQLLTRRQVPVFLASSFAFIAPISAAVPLFGLSATMGGLMAAGVIYLLLALLVKVRGVVVIERLLPPVVVGPVIMVIGLILAPVAVNMALGKSGDGALVLVPQDEAMIIAAIALLGTVATAVFGRGVMKLVPILAGLAAGYITALAFGHVSFAAVGQAAWLALPNFTLPSFDLGAILFLLPVAIAPAVEHVGDVLAISNVTGKNYLEKPGLHRTLAGDGLATMLASAVGGPPNTTYSEVTGAVMLTKAFNPVIMTWAAVVAIALAFVGKLGALLQTIPVPVMGGILVLLFGSIAVVGLNTLVRHRVDLAQPRNLAIVAITLVAGIGKLGVTIGSFRLEGIALCAVVAIVLNLLLPKGERSSQ